MSNPVQAEFISRWNSVASKLSYNPFYKKIPRLPNGISGGVCTGLSFALAEYVSLNRSERFYELYNVVCECSPATLARAYQLYSREQTLINEHHRLRLKNKSQEKQAALNARIEQIKEYRKSLFPNQNRDDNFLDELINFIYKIYILQKKQIEGFPLGDHQIESEDEKRIRLNVNKPNHDRIGNPIKTFGTDMGEINDKIYKNVQKVIQGLTSNESLDFGIREVGIGGDHSVLLYYNNNQYTIFDSNRKKKVSVSKPDEAAKEIIYCINQCITNGSDKFTSFDRCWAASHLFKITAIVLFPLAAIWLFYDVFIAKPLSKEKLSEAPLMNSVWLTWSKIRKKEGALLNDSGSVVSEKKPALAKKEKSLLPSSKKYPKRSWLEHATSAAKEQDPQKEAHLHKLRL